MDLSDNKQLQVISQLLSRIRQTNSQDSTHCQISSQHTSIMNNSPYEANANNVWVTGIDNDVTMRTLVEDCSSHDSITDSAGWQNVNQSQSRPGQMPGQFQAPEVNMADVQINGSDLTIEMNQARICGQGLIEIVLTVL